MKNSIGFRVIACAIMFLGASFLMSSCSEEEDIIPSQQLEQPATGEDDLPPQPPNGG